MNQRSFRPSRRPAWLSAGVLALALAASYWNRSHQEQPTEPLAEGRYRVERAVDGDTLLLTDRTRLRLIGVNAPETVKPEHPVEPWGPEASKFTKEFVRDGAVRLQFDRERTDQFGRWLAYVWVEDQMLNEELLRQGLARWEPHYHYSDAMKRRFRKAQDEAKQAHRGIWSVPAP